MKKSTKRHLIAALACAVIGAAFCLTSVIAGFRIGDFQEAVEAGELEGEHIFGNSLRINGKTIRIHGLLENIWPSFGTTDFDGTFERVRSLEVDTGAYDCILIKSDSKKWRVRGENLPSSFRAEMDGDTLSVDASRGWMFWNPGSTSGRLEIYVPENVTLDQVKANIGVGDLILQNGVLSCRKLDLDCGVGEVDLDVDIEKSARIDCGVGDVTLMVKGSERDFDFDLDYGIGDLTVGSRQYSGLGGEQKINNHASKKIDVDCGVGNVVIGFTEKEN